MWNFHIFVSFPFKDHYGNNLYFAEISGRSNVVCFKDMADRILNDLKKKSTTTTNDIITAAAKLIKSDIRQMPSTMNEYPSIDSLNCIEYVKSWVPESLQILLNHLICSELKRVSIGQCITQASRSTIASILFGIGVDLDKSFGSKWLINHLSKFGFSISANEVALFKESAIESMHSTGTDEGREFIHWVADNVDHNIATLTGKRTFHGMGIIAISSSRNEIRHQAIQRLKEHAKKSSYGLKHNIDIILYTGSYHNGL